MPHAIIQCWDCGAEVGVDQRHCAVCSADNGAPNLRVALSEFAALRKSAEDARESAESRGAGPKVKILEYLSEKSSVSINIPIGFLLQLLRNDGTNFTPYLKLTRSDVRKMMREAVDHIFRQIADTTLFPNYESEILFGALCPKDDGIISYGECTLKLREKVISKRVSLLIDDSYNVIENYCSPGEEPPEGLRSVWEDRCLLAIAKCAPNLSRSTRNEAIVDHLMRSRGGFLDDVFIEAHIYGMMDIRAIESVRLSDAPRRRSDPAQWEEIKDLAESAGIAWSEGVDVNGD